ncbi:hypothetical protein ES703_99202 [subsurface metagenome]
MSYQNDLEAFTLAHEYGFCPIPTGKYEPGVSDDPPLEWMRFAQPYDHTCIYVKYEPRLNLTVPYHVTNGLDPDASGNYMAESGYNDKPTYVSPDREFFIWWEGVDSWIINGQVGHLNGPYWKRTDPTIAGAYDPVDGAVGIATVVAGEE